MHLSMHNWMRAEPVEVTVRRLAKYGYESSEITGEPYIYNTKDVRKTLKENGIKCWGSVTLMLGDGNLVAKNEAQRAKSVQYTKDCITMVKELEGYEMTIVPATVGKIVPDGPPEEEWKWAVESLKECYDWGKKEGVVLAVEPINRFETYFCSRAAQALARAEGVAPDCGVCLDAFPLNIEEGDPIYASLGLWSLASPAGYWFSSLSALEPMQTSQGPLHHPRGSFSFTYYVSIVVQYPLLVRQILDGRRAVVAGSRVDGWIWIISIALVLLGGTHDHLVDFGLLTPPYLAEYPFPLAILAMGTRYAQRRSREFARLNQLQDALMASEAKLRELYESSSDAIFVHDAGTGAIIDINRTMCELYGYTREESLTLSVGDPI